MAIVRQIPWTEQPQEAAPLRADLNITLTWVGTPAKIEHLRTYPTTDFGVVDHVVGAAGWARGFAGTDRGIRLDADENTTFPNGSACTIAVYRRHRDTTARNSGCISNNSAGTDRINLNAPWGDGNCYWDWGNTTSGSGRLSVAWGTKSTAYEASVFVAGGGKGREIWRAGRKLASNTGATASRTTGSSFNRLGFFTSGSGSDLEDFALVVVSSRAWTDAEVVAWCSNPYGETFAPRTQRIWTAAAGGAYSITAQPGSYALSGQTSTITRSRLLTGSAGSYAVSGQNATVSRSRLITASAGAYAIAGQSATLVRSRLITAQAGAYTYTGQSATITYAGAGAYTLTALAGSYALTGQTATMTKSRVINASAGSYALAGKAASITYSGAPAPTGLSGVYFDVLSGRLLVLRSGT